MKRNDTGSKSDLKGLTLDEWDKKNLENMLKLFKSCPFTFTRANGTKFTWTGRQWINWCIKDARKSIDNTAEQKSWKKNEMDIRKSLSLPPPLMTMLKEAYPALLSDSVQFNTFLKWFPELRLDK